MRCIFKQQPHRKGMATWGQGGGEIPVGLNGDEKDCENTFDGVQKMMTRNFS
jgi:hypothetical protein